MPLQRGICAVLVLVLRPVLLLKQQVGLSWFVSSSQQCQGSQHQHRCCEVCHFLAVCQVEMPSNKLRRQPAAFVRSFSVGQNFVPPWFQVSVTTYPSIDALGPF